MSTMFASESLLKIFTVSITVAGLSACSSITSTTSKYNLVLPTAKKLSVSNITVPSSLGQNTPNITSFSPGLAIAPPAPTGSFSGTVPTPSASSPPHPASIAPPPPIGIITASISNGPANIADVIGAQPTINAADHF